MDPGGDEPTPDATLLRCGHVCPEALQQRLLSQEVTFDVCDMCEGAISAFDTGSTALDVAVAIADKGHARQIRRPSTPTTIWGQNYIQNLQALGAHNGPLERGGNFRDFRGGEGNASYHFVSVRFSPFSPSSPPVGRLLSNVGRLFCGSRGIRGEDVRGHTNDHSVLPRNVLPCTHTPSSVGAAPTHRPAQRIFHPL
jgi:hypothetical protein